MTPFDLCDLAYDEHVELQLKVIEVYVPVKTIYAGLFQRGQTIEVNRDELARRLQTARKTKRALSAEERNHLPNRVTFKIIDR